MSDQGDQHPTQDPHGSQPPAAPAHDDHAGDHAADDHGGHGGLAKYIYVFVALCVLTTASFMTASPYWPFHQTEKVGWVFMMAVSCTKAMLVILFFMHVKYEANWKYVLTIPAAFMSIFLILMLVPDVGMRNKTEGWAAASEERRQFMADPSETAGKSRLKTPESATHSLDKPRP